MKFNITKGLESIGLTERQSNIYLELLKRGPSKIGVLQSALMVHKQLIYNDLSFLEGRGYVSVMKKNNRRHFSAVNPDIFLEENQRQHTRIEQLIPQLHATIGWEQGASEMNIFEGAEAIQAFHRAKIKNYPTNSEAYILGGGGKRLLQVMEPNFAFAYYDSVRERKNISQKLLMQESQRGTCPKYTDGRFKSTVRYMQTNMPNVMATGIWFDSISLLFFLDKPKLVEIKSHQAVQTYKEYFNLLWKQAKP